MAPTGLGAGGNTQAAGQFCFPLVDGEAAKGGGHTGPSPATWVCLYPHPYSAFTPSLVSASGSRKGN